MNIFVYVLLGILVAALLSLCLLILHKIRRVHLMQYDLQQLLEEKTRHTYQQIQALIDLNRLLRLDWSLPPLGGWSASSDFLLLLAEHMLQHKPNCIVECSSGVSTIVLAQCAKLNGSGHILSLEHDAYYAKKTRQLLINHGLQNWATVVDAPLKEYILNGRSYHWYSLDASIENLRIDMLSIDGPPANVNQYARYPAGPLLLPLLNVNGIVFLDDADRADEQEIIRRWISELKLDVYRYSCEKGAVSLKFSIGEQQNAENSLAL